MNLQEQHWNNLWKSYNTQGKAWHGIWTVYSPEKTVIKSFQAIRKIWTNPDKTIIYHTNTYIDENGDTTEKRWEMNKETSNLSDGLYHPAVLSMRGFSSENGADVWVSKKYELGQAFGAELFFQTPSSRTSISHIYGESGSLVKITHIQEYLDKFPSQSFLELIEPITQTWQGKQTLMTPDLKIYSNKEIKNLVLNQTGDDTVTTLLPDKIICNAPQKIELGKKFEINVGKFLSENFFKRITIYYDEEGQFSQLVSEIWQKLNH